MTELRQVVTDAYQRLRKNNLVQSQYDFSRNWLHRSAGYYGYLKSSGSEPTADTVLTLLNECGQREQFSSDAAQSARLSEFARDLFEKQAKVVEQLRDHVRHGISFK